MLYADDKCFLIVTAGDRRLNPYRGNRIHIRCVERLPSGGFFFLAFFLGPLWAVNVCFIT